MRQVFVYHQHGGNLSRKFWSAINFGPGDQNSWKIGPLDHYFLKVLGRAWNYGRAERKYFGVSTLHFQRHTFVSKCLYSITNPKEIFR